MDTVVTIPLVVDYLKTHSLAQLKSDYGVEASFAKDGTKMSLNYNQINSKSGVLLSDQCRGLILRVSDEFRINFLRGEQQRLENKLPYGSASWLNCTVGNTKVIAWPFNRFYNHGDSHSKSEQFKWDDGKLSIFEKLDGTLCIVYYDELYKKWCVGTRSVPNADLPIYGNHISLGETTFAELFLKALISTAKTISPYDVDLRNVTRIDEILDLLYKGTTYMFELTTPYTKLVVEHETSSVTLLGARNCNGQELPVDGAQSAFMYCFGGYIPIPKKYKISSINELVEYVNFLPPNKSEGCVVVDSNFNRFKVKSKAYVMASRAKDLVTSSKRNVIEAIIDQTIDDIIPIVSEDIAKGIEDIREKFRVYLASIDKNFNEFIAETGNDRKFFAEKVLLSRDWVAPYFALYDNKGTNVTDWLENLSKTNKLSSSVLKVILDKLGL